MNAAIQRAIGVMGSVSALAKALGVTSSAAVQWRDNDRPIPIERCVQIEQLTAGAVRRWDLRPDDWHRIWPELVGADGAPPVPAESKEVA